VPISELVFGTLTQNWSSLEPARRALRTAVPLLLILRTEGGTKPPPTWVKVLGVALNLVIIGVIVAIVLLD
jgi:hypothetical protein